MPLLKKAKEQATVKVLLNLLKLADEPAYEHSLSVAEITNEFLKLIPNEEWDEAMRIKIITGALLHDIGKAFIPFNLHSCSRSLDFNTKKIVQTHPNIGYEIVKDCFCPEVEDIVLLHHEKADGSGYPNLTEDGLGLFNESNIPDYVTIVSYADILDALITPKLYRNSLSLSDACAVIEKEIDQNKLSYKFKNVLLEYVRQNTLME